MRKRPFWFTAMSATMALVAISFPVQVMAIYGHGIDEMDAVLAKITSLNWLVIASLMVSSLLLWRANPLCRFVAPIVIALVALNNSIVAHYGTDYTFWTAHMASLGFIALNLPLLDGHVQFLLNNPDKRWWFRAQRKRVNLAVTIEGTRLDPEGAYTFDLSRTGAFVCGGNALHVGVGDWVTLRLQLGDFNSLKCQARVIRRVEAKGIYPPGVGVRFMNLNWRERRELRRWLERDSSPTL